MQGGEDAEDKSETTGNQEIASQARIDCSLLDMGTSGAWDPTCLPFLPHPTARSSNQWEVGGVGKQPEREQLSAGEREQLPAFEGDSPTAPPNLLPPQGGLPGCLPPTPLWGSEEAEEEAS